MDLEEVFCAAGVNPRSHCLTICKEEDIILYASDGHLVAEDVPLTAKSAGKILNVSERRHSKPITVVKKISPCKENIFISGCNNGNINLWELKDRKIDHIVALDKLPIAVTSVTGSARDDELIIVSSWGGVSTGIRAYWLTKIGQEYTIRSQSDLKQASASFALSLDTSMLSTGNLLLATGTSLRKIDLYVENKEKNCFDAVLSFIAHEDWIHSISFNHNNSSILLASAGQDSYIRLWKISKEASNEKNEEELCVTKNKFYVPTVNGDVAHTINVEAVLAGHEDWVHSTEWNSSGDLLVTSSSDKTAIVWTEVNGIWTDSIRLGIVGGQAAGFFSAVFTNDNRGLVASSYFGGLHAWRELNENEPWAAIPMVGGHIGEVRDLSWEPKGRYLLSCGNDKTTRLYSKIDDNESLAEIARPQCHGHEMQCVCSISSTRFVSGGEEKIFRAFQAPITFANSLATISGVKKEEVFDMNDLAEAGAQVPALGLSNKAVDQTKPDVPEEGHWEETQFLANPVDLDAVPTEDCLQQNTLWPELHKLYGHGFEVYSIACNPSSTVLATACKASQPDHAAIHLWDTVTWALKNIIMGHSLTVTQIEWDSTGQYILSVSRDRTVAVYKEKNGDIHGFEYEKIWQSQNEHSRIVWSGSWIPKTHMFATGSRDKKLILWKFDEDHAYPILTHVLPQPITAVAASRRNLIACGLQDGSLAILKVKEDQIEEQITALTTKVPVDSAVLRLRFAESDEPYDKLAYAGFDGKVRVFKLH